jgi:hypothetical protein
MIRSPDKSGKQSPNEMESFRSLDIRFIGEQDGSAERDLKALLVARFQADIHVTEAYLVRVRYAGAPEPQVALCLAAGDQVRSEITEAVGSEFRKMFKTTESLDILFLSKEQQDRIREVASPFYQQHAYRA